MLYRLEIENFYSIRSPQVLDLRVADNVPDAPNRLDPIFPGSTERAPRVAAIFGPNASGKTTVLKALNFITWFVCNSFQWPLDRGLPCEHFNSNEAASNEIHLAIEAGAHLEPVVFGEDGPGSIRYEVSLRSLGGRVVVVSEALRYKYAGKTKWSRSFERVGGNFKGGTGYGFMSMPGFARRIRDNASVISTLAQNNHEPSLAVRRGFLKRSTNLETWQANADVDIAHPYKTSPNTLKSLVEVVGQIDLGIRDVQLIDGDRGQELAFSHNGHSRALTLQSQSNGTKSFLKNFPIIDKVVKDGGMAVIDEIDVNIHPMILPVMLRWFHDPERNPHQSQLWMTTHSASLLDDLIKEEIFLCDKDSEGQTHIFALQDVKGVRRLDNHYRKYLSGVYGAVPNIG